jgi:His-Xaa-Ser system protein HxsD
MACCLQAKEEGAMSAGTSAPAVTFDESTTSLDAIQRAVYAVADVMTVDIAADDGTFICTMYARNHAADADELAHSLRAEVIDQTLRLRIAEQTEPLRNLIFALAFSETGLGDAPETSS